jgi:hypothetical protein
VRRGRLACAAETEHAFVVAGDGEVELAAIGPFRHASETFIRAISRLRWSSQAVNRRVAAAVRQVRAVLALRPPDLCRQAAIARVASFTRTPPAIRTFARRFVMAAFAPSSSADELAHLMKPFADPHDLAAIKRVDVLQRREGAILSPLTYSANTRLDRALFGLTSSR